jgi:hypothetical protein
MLEKLALELSRLEPGKALERRVDATAQAIAVGEFPASARSLLCPNYEAPAGSSYVGHLLGLRCHPQWAAMVVTRLRAEKKKH